MKWEENSKNGEKVSFLQGWPHKYSSALQQDGILANPSSSAYSFN